jgi:hypothetical protein
VRGWVKALQSDSCSLIQIAQSFLTSPEFQHVYGIDPAPGAFVAAACRNALGHAPGPTEIQGWVEFLIEHGNGKAARAATVIGIANSMAFLEGSAGPSANAA